MRSPDEGRQRSKRQRACAQKAHRQREEGQRLRHREHLTTARSKQRNAARQLLGERNLPFLKNSPAHCEAQGTARPCGVYHGWRRRPSPSPLRSTQSTPERWTRRGLERVCCYGAIVAVVSAWSLASCGGGPQELGEDETFYSRNRVELYSGLEPDAPAVAVLDFDTRARIWRRTEALSGCVRSMAERAGPRRQCCLTAACAAGCER